MSERPASQSAAAEKAIGTMLNPELDARYPNRTHFVDADNPDRVLLMRRALLAGDPVALVYPDSREVIFTPEQVPALSRLLFGMGMRWMKLRGHADARRVQLPPGVRIEPRDGSDLGLAA
jgi:hypothetical protein